MQREDEVEKFKIQFLSKEDRKRIHKGALYILEKGRFKIENLLILKELAKRGAKIDESSQMVSFPPELVEESLQTVGRKPIIYTISGKPLHLYGKNRYYGSIVIDPFVLDYEKGLRKPIVSDVARHTRLGDALPKIDSIYKMDQECGDAPGIISDIETLKVFISNTTTSYLCAPASMNSARLWVEVAEIMAGGNLKKNPVLIGYVSPISPLKLDSKSIEMMRLFIQHGVLLRCGPCPIAGATSPYPLAGTLVQGWAEVLVQIVISQILKEGVAIQVVIGSSSLDMRTGNDLYGGPAKDILHLAALEMAEEFDLSTSLGIFSTLCSYYDLQNGAESAICATFHFFKRNHLLSGLGSLSNACGVSAEQILFHHNLIEMMEWYAKGIDCSDEKLALESIIKVGPGGNFLMDDLTLKFLRTDEHFLPSNFVVDVYGKKEKKKFIENLHEIVEELISTHKPDVPQKRLEDALKFLEKEKSKLGR